MTATVDPYQSLLEADYNNNAGSLQVEVVAPYKLVAFMGGSSTPIPDSGGGLTLVPSVNACGQIPDSEDGDTGVEVRCVLANDPALVPVAGCQFLLDVSQGPDTGGHSHTPDTRPFTLNPPTPSFPTGKFLPVDTMGNGLTYAPPEVAGDVFLEVTGQDPNGHSIAGPSFMFHVKDTRLGAMVSLDGTGANLGPTGNNPGIEVNSSPSHPGQGIYGTTAMSAAVAKMVQKYYKLGDAAGFASFDTLASQGATLIEGGLFDANWDGAVPSVGRLTPWEAPHCGHRNGITIDLSVKQLDPDEVEWLRKAASEAGLPPIVETDHWHAKLQ